MNQILTTTNFYRNGQRVNGEAMISVSKSSSGQFKVSTWLPAGMNFHADMPEWIDRTNEITEARKFYAKRRDYLRSKGFLPQMGS